MHGKPDQFDTTWAAGLDSGLDSPWSKAGEGSQLAVADMRAVERDQRSSAHSDDLPPSGRPRPHKLRRLASISAAIGCGVTAVVVVTAVLALQGDNREAVSPNQETPNSERRISTDVELGQFTASFGDRRGELLVWARGSGVVAIDLRSGVANPFVWGDENTKPEIFVSSKQMLLIVARDGSAAMVNSSGELWELGELAKPEPTDQTAIVDPSNDSILWTQLSRLGDESSFPIRIFPDGSRELVPLAVPAGATPIAVAPGRGLVIASDAGGTFLLGDTGAQRLSTGQPVAVGWTKVIVEECADDLVCVHKSINLETLTISTVERSVSDLIGAMNSPSISPDGAGLIGQLSVVGRPDGFTEGLAYVSLAPVDGSQVVVMDAATPRKVAWSGDGDGVWLVDDDGCVAFRRVSLPAAGRSCAMGRVEALAHIP